MRDLRLASEVSSVIRDYAGAEETQVWKWLSENREAAHWLTQIAIHGMRRKYSFRVNYGQRLEDYMRYGDGYFDPIESEVLESLLAEDNPTGKDEELLVGENFFAKRSSWQHVIEEVNRYQLRLATLREGLERLLTFQFTFNFFDVYLPGTVTEDGRIPVLRKKNGVIRLITSPEELQGAAIFAVQTAPIAPA